MKKDLVIVTILTALVFLSGCELSKDFIFTIQKEFTVSYNSTAIDKVEIINAAESSKNLDKYKDDLKSVQVEKVTYTITYFNGPSSQQINSAALAVAPAMGSAFTQLAAMSNVNLMAVASTEQELDVDEAGEDVLEAALLGDDHTFQMKYSGTANEAPLNFKVKFKVTCKVKYEKKLI